MLSHSPAPFTVRIADRSVGGPNPCFVIAEVGVNHNGDVGLAARLIDAAADAGADAVKFQTFHAEGVAAPEAPKAPYQLRTTDAGESQLEMLRGLELDWDAHVALKERAEKRGLVFLSTPFDLPSVRLLDRLGVAAMKVASPDVTNLPLLEEIGHCGRPVILSTGLAYLAEVEAAVAALRAAGATEIVVLHCVSEYPAPPEGVNLRAMATMREGLRLPVGYSDHTEGSEIALAAVSLGAAAIEKHLTLDRSLPGPDHRSSLEPEELVALVRAVRRVESSFGDGIKAPTAAERQNAPVVRRSLAAADDLPAGVVIERGMLTALRPGTGISPSRVDDVVGRRLRRPVARYELLEADDLE